MIGFAVGTSRDLHVVVLFGERFVITMLLWAQKKTWLSRLRYVPARLRELEEEIEP